MVPGKRHVQVHVGVYERNRGWCLKGSHRSPRLRRRGDLNGLTIEIHGAGIGAELLLILGRKTRENDDDSLPVGETKETRGRSPSEHPQDAEGIALRSNSRRTRASQEYSSEWKENGALRGQAKRCHRELRLRRLAKKHREPRKSCPQRRV